LFGPEDPAEMLNAIELHLENEAAKVDTWVDTWVTKVRADDHTAEVDPAGDWCANCEG